MAMEINAICIWPDVLGEHNEDGSYRWIVSRDAMDGEGRNISNTTLDVCDDRDAALKSAKDSAEELMLPIYENGENTAAVLLLELHDILPWDHIGDAGVHQSHHLHLDDMQDVHCIECNRI